MSKALIPSSYALSIIYNPLEKGAPFYADSEENAGEYLPTKILIFTYKSARQISPQWGHEFSGGSPSS